MKKPKTEQIKKIYIKSKKIKEKEKVKSKTQIKKPIKEKPKKNVVKEKLVKQQSNLKPLVKLQSKTTKDKKTGYFKGGLTSNLLKAFIVKNPTIAKNKIAKKFNISQQTFNKVITGKKVSIKTLHKVSTGLNSVLDSSKQVEYSLIAEHLNRYKTISDKKLKAIKDKIKKIKNNIDKLPNKQYIFFKIQYAQNKNIAITKILGKIK